MQMIFRILKAFMIYKTQQNNLISTSCTTIFTVLLPFPQKLYKVTRLYDRKKGHTLLSKNTGKTKTGLGQGMKGNIRESPARNRTSNQSVSGT